MAGNYRREDVEKLIQEANNLLSELEQQLLSSTDPVERTRLKQEIERKKKQIAEFEGELGRLPIDEQIERKYLEAVVERYKELLDKYTETSAALTLNENEKRRHAALYDLMSQRHPPRDVSERFAPANPEFLEKREAIVRAPILEQVATMKSGAVLGAPGAGKSTTLRRLALRYALIGLGREQPAENDPHTGKIPVLVPLGGYGGEDLFEFAKWFLARPPFSDEYAHSEKLAQRLDTYLEEGRVLVLFDAINEVADDYRAAAFDKVGKFAAEYTYKGNSFFVSCREADYSQGFADLPRLVLEPLDDEGIATFLENYFPHKPEAPQTILRQLGYSPQLNFLPHTHKSTVSLSILLKLVANGWQLRQLVRNPYLLKVVVEVYEERNCRVLAG